VRLIVGQLRVTEELIGCPMRAQPLRRRYWTLPVWQDERALGAFVAALLHAHVRSSMAGRMGSTEPIPR
jgi:hypothetical protein